MELHLLQDAANLLDQELVTTRFDKNVRNESLAVLAVFEDVVVPAGIGYYRSW